MKDLTMEFGLKKRKAFEYVRMERKVRFRGKRLHYEQRHGMGQRTGPVLQRYIGKKEWYRIRTHRKGA